MLPKALVVGCSIQEFWYEEPSLLKSYSKAHELRQKDSIDEWKMKVNFTSWLQGAYMKSAIASALSKDAHYPNKPFDLFSDEISEEQRLIDSEEAIKRRSKQIDEMLSKNKKASSQFSVKT